MFLPKVCRPTALSSFDANESNKRVCETRKKNRAGLISFFFLLSLPVWLFFSFIPSLLDGDSLSLSLSLSRCGLIQNGSDRKHLTNVTGPRSTQEHNGVVDCSHYRPGVVENHIGVFGTDLNGVAPRNWGSKDNGLHVGAGVGGDGVARVKAQRNLIKRIRSTEPCPERSKYGKVGIDGADKRKGKLQSTGRTPRHGCATVHGAHRTTFALDAIVIRTTLNSLVVSSQYAHCGH